MANSANPTQSEAVLVSSRAGRAVTARATSGDRTRRSIRTKAVSSTAATTSSTIVRGAPHICAAAGIGRRTFFRYFATKDDVLTEPAREMAERVAAAIASAPEGAPDPAVLRHALTEIASYALDPRARLRQLTEVMESSAGVRLPPLAPPSAAGLP